MKIKLTRHSKERLRERVYMSILTLRKIYKKNLYLTTGKEKKGYRCHDLFYSTYMDQCFVAIRDERTNTIITILPLDYHEYLGWRISFAAQQMVINLVHENLQCK